MGRKIIRWRAKFKMIEQILKQDAWLVSPELLRLFGILRNFQLLLKLEPVKSIKQK